MDCFLLSAMDLKPILRSCTKILFSRQTDRQTDRETDRHGRLEPLSTYKQGCTNPGLLIAPATKLFTVA